MDPRGAKFIDWSDVATMAAEQNYTVDIPTGTGENFANLLCFLNCPEGVLALYGGSEFTAQNGTFTQPMQIDWRLHHGTQKCIYDQDPAAGSTLLASQDPTVNPLQREGLLFQMGGLMADSYLLRGRVLGTGRFILRVTIYPRVTPGLGGAVLGITVGSLIG